MASTPGPAHRSVTSIRPSGAAPSSPTTPVRAIPSTFGSPSALRAEDECVIIELGSRFLRAGFASDAAPKAVIAFDPEHQRRAGDFRNWVVGYAANWRRRAGNSWTDGYELWQLDIRELDMELVGNKIAAALREAYVKYLLTDSRPRRMVLVLPSNIPLALLSTTLDSLFVNFQPPTITLMSTPILTTIAAGLRAALTVDIGWAETVVCATYEYREIQHRQSVRAGKKLTQEMLRTLVKAIGAQTGRPAPDDSSDLAETTKLYQDVISFEECEDITSRMAWCKPLRGDTPNSTTAIPLTSTKPPITLALPFSMLSQPCERALFADGKDLRTLDDEELPLHMLIYKSLLHLPVDARSMCMSRIIFTGGVSKLPGLKERTMDELQQIIDQRGWDPVVGKAVDQLREKMSRAKIDDVELASEEQNGAAFADQEPDVIDERLQREAKKGTQPTVQGVLRAVESLGAWSGASLLSHLKIPAISVVEREQWLHHGVYGASKPGEISTAKQRQSVGLRAGERNSWTLGIWG